MEKADPGHLLRLRAEMKMPGEGWLQFEANEGKAGSTELVQTAYFAPKGLSGLLYWYGIYPLHGAIFSRMIDAVARQAIDISSSQSVSKQSSMELDAKTVASED